LFEPAQFVRYDRAESTAAPVAAKPTRHRIEIRGEVGEGRGKRIMHFSLRMKASVPVDVLIQELQSESVLLNVDTGRYFGLDDIGTRMWTVLTTAQSLQAACDTLVNEYDVEEHRLEQDMRALVEKLLERGLLEVRDG
jgi:hypothetical protein